MSCALHAFAIAGKESTEDTKDVFQLGTWEFPTYFGFIEHLLSKKINFNKGHNCVYYAFSPEECHLITKKLHATLSLLPKKGPLKDNEKHWTTEERKAMKNYIGLGKQPAYPAYNPLCLSDVNWYQRLLTIFKSGKAIYYSI